jgi:hypothetical protein
MIALDETGSEARWRKLRGNRAAQPQGGARKRGVTPARAS